MSTLPLSDRKKVTLHTLQAKKQRGEPITVLTAYDYATASALDQAGIDIILVGDSLGMVVLGYTSTLSVTMDDMLHHCRAVARGAQRAHLVGDMPFMSYQTTPVEAVRNAGRFFQEAGMEAVKLEGGREMAATVAAIVAAGMPVMGHLGLTPQSIHKLGGFRTQGKSHSAARRLVEDAHCLEDAGCYALVLESIPDRVAELISRQLTIPTIGIGAGSGCDGQVLVTNDLLGLFDRFTPKFVKRYAQLHAEMQRAFADYIAEVGSRQFPAAEHTQTITEEEYAALVQELGAADLKREA
jgi:3-methyl-2-oxobutanoate hydroxymethyltransferase